MRATYKNSLINLFIVRHCVYKLLEAKYST